MPSFSKRDLPIEATVKQKDPVVIINHRERINTRVPLFVVVHSARPDINEPNLVPATNGQHLRACTRSCVMQDDCATVRIYIFEIDEWTAFI